MRKLISSFVFSILLLSGNGWGATYYVDQSGGDNAKNGLSPANAWKTIAKVNASNFAAGDSILFKRGETWRESLTVPSSGSAGNPITFGAYGTGAKPIIQPTTLITGPWTKVGATNVYYATYASTPRQVFVDNAYCQPAHWPVAVGNSTPTFAYPSANSGNTTTIIDSALAGKVSADMVGANLYIYTNAWTQKNATVSAWNNSTYTMTIDSVSTNPTTSMRYYLTGMVWMITENTWAYDTGTQRLYLWKRGGGDPTTAAVEASSDNSAINATDKSYITIDGLAGRFAGDYGIHINNYYSNINNINIINSETYYTAGTGIVLSPLQASRGYTIDNFIIDNNVVDHGKGRGILAQGSTSGGDVKNNKVTYSGGVYPQLPGNGMGIHTNLNAGTTDNNTVSYSAYNGIMVSGSNSTIRNNTISHTNIYSEDGGGIYGATNGALISYNNLSDTGYGIYFDEVSTNGIVEHNTVTGGSSGILWHRAYTMTAYGNRLTGPFTSGYAFLVNNDAATGPLTIKYNIIDSANNTSRGLNIGMAANGLVDIYNNDILNSSIGIWIINNANVVGNIKNNIFYNNSVNIDANSGNAVSINNNLYYGSGTWSWGGVTRTTLALWKAASSQDGASITGDPRFISTSNYSLTENSPAINAGTNVNLTSDYFGNPVPSGPAPDIGAYEYTPFTIPVPPIYSPLKTPVPPTNLKISP